VKTVHVMVALCDAEHQGVVAPPRLALCNGDDPARNLYWGALYGTKTHLLAQGWKRVAHLGDPPPGVLKRVVLEKRAGGKAGPQRVVVVADAWQGRRIKEATQTFLARAAGHDFERVALTDGRVVLVGGQADMVVYVGHDGLMDFQVSSPPRRKGKNPPPQNMVFACMSRDFFRPHFKKSGARPQVDTTGLMAPEGYVLHASLMAWARGEDGEGMRAEAARAYARYQKIHLNPARRLFGLSPP
jgi:hypothetical protein